MFMNIGYIITADDIMKQSLQQHVKIAFNKCFVICSKVKCH